MLRISMRRCPMLGFTQNGRKAGWVRVLARLPIFDVRLVGAIALASMILPRIVGEDTTSKLTPSRLARGEPGEQILSFALSPDGTEIATTNRSGRVRLRALDTGVEVLSERSTSRGMPGRSRSRPQAICSLRRDRHRRLASGTSRRRQGSPPRSCPFPSAMRCSFTFSPDGRCLAVVPRLDGAIVLWDLARRQAGKILRHPAHVMNTAFSPDGRQLAVAAGRAVYLWDLETGTWSVVTEGGFSLAVAVFSPDGSLLASASRPEHHARLWDVETRSMRRAFSGHARSVTLVTFSPDGSLLATAGNDGTVALWAVATGECLASLDPQANWLSIAGIFTGWANARAGDGKRR